MNRAAIGVAVAGLMAVGTFWALKKRRNVRVGGCRFCAIALLCSSLTFVHCIIVVLVARE